MNEIKPPLEIPSEALAPETLDSLVEEFILREGTDYGAQEVSLERKKEQIYKQLESSRIKIMFDPNTESVTFVVNP